MRIRGCEKRLLVVGLELALLGLALALIWVGSVLH